MHPKYYKELNPKQHSLVWQTVADAVVFFIALATLLVLIGVMALGQG